jgi:hypothetical protein
MSDRTITDEPAVEKARDAVKLFKWSAFAHAGDGAEECEHATDGKCSDDEHFHAWLRLPNQFQNEEITERADAARARRLRLMRDPDSDSRIIMEAAVDEMIRDLTDEEIVDDLLIESHTDARRLAEGEVKREEAELFEHVYRDLERHGELLHQEDRPQEEFDALDKHLDDFFARVASRIKVIQKPKRDEYEGMDRAGLREAIIEQRIQADTQRVWYASFQVWEWVAGTHRLTGKWVAGRPADRYFETEKDLKDASIEAIGALTQGFADLHSAITKDARGN